MRRRRLWIAAGVAGFIFLSAVPAGLDRAPKWATLRAARELSQLLGALRTRVAVEHVALRFRFESDSELAYVVEKAESCAAQAVWTIDHGGRLSGDSGHALRPVPAADEPGELGTVTSVCVDQIAGFVPGRIGIVPVKDLASLREDRTSWVVLPSASALISFE